LEIVCSLLFRNNTKERNMMQILEPFSIFFDIFDAADQQNKDAIVSLLSALFNAAEQSALQSRVQKDTVDILVMLLSSFVPSIQEQAAAILRERRQKALDSKHQLVQKLEDISVQAGQIEREVERLKRVAALTELQNRGAAKWLVEEEKLKTLLAQQQERLNEIEETKVTKFIGAMSEMNGSVEYANR
jgi:leucyl-tRNA synthetase